jgi:predicted dehydrogenase
MKKKVLIIGLGKIGLLYDFHNKYFLTHSKSFYYNKHFKIVGGVDKSVLCRKLFNKRYKKRVFSNYKVAATITNPDLFVVSTPSDSHYKIISYLIKKYNSKIIICEKPFTNSLNNAQKILNQAKKKKINVFVNYTRTSDILMKRLLINLGFLKNKNNIANIFYTGTVMEGASHFINFLQSVFGDVIKIIVIEKKLFYIDFKLYFKNITIYFFSSNLRNNYVNECNFYSNKYQLSIFNGGFSFVLKKKYRNSIYNDSSVFYKTIKDKKNIFYLESQKKFVEEIHSFINKKNFDLCNSEMALTTHKIIKKIYAKR